MDMDKLRKNLKLRGMESFYAPSAEVAVTHLLEQIHGTTVGIGGSKTIEALNLYDRLRVDNEVHWHWRDGWDAAVFHAAAQAEVYLSSVNAIAETGELVNMDGRGNRAAALTFGEGKRIFIVASTKKICPDLPSAIERVRTVAAPRNVQKLPGKRPCSVTGTCVDCRSPDRGCCVLQTILFKPMNTKKLEVILLDADLGY